MKESLRAIEQNSSGSSRLNGKKYEEGNNDVSPQKKDLLSRAPKLRYDVDLYTWGEDAKPTKVLIQKDSHRFWGSPPEENEIEVPGSSETQRVIEFAGDALKIK